MANQFPNPDFDDPVIPWVGQGTATGPLWVVSGRGGHGARWTTQNLVVQEGPVSPIINWPRPFRAGDVLRIRAQVLGLPAAVAGLMQCFVRDAASAILVSGNVVAFNTIGGWQEVSGLFVVGAAGDGGVKVNVKLVTTATAALDITLDNVFIDYANSLQSFIARRRRR